MDHSLTHYGGWTCSVCLWHWKSKPQSLCPGVPRYTWEQVPSHLKTQTQLGKIGLKVAPGQHPAGCVSSCSKTDYYWLYDVGQASSKRKATAAQLVASAQRRSQLEESKGLAKAGRGALEPYREGLIEVRPSASRWYLTGVHLPDGEVFDVGGSFTTHTYGITFGKQVMDWIIANPHKIAAWGCYTGEINDGGLGVTLHRKQHFCYLPYRYSKSKLVVSLLSQEATGWAEAIKLPYVAQDGSLIVCDSGDEAIAAGWSPAWTIG
jgi:hypothetical protein